MFGPIVDAAHAAAVEARAHELHDAECCTDCPFGVTPSWYEYAEISLRADAERAKRAAR